MGYWVSLNIDTGNPEGPVCVWDDNQTGNVAPMWCKAGADLTTFKGKLAGEVVAMLEAAIVEMRDNPEPYRAMNPSNGWGSYDTCLAFLRGFRDACKAHPKCTVHVNW